MYEQMGSVVTITLRYLLPIDSNEYLSSRMFIIRQEYESSVLHSHILMQGYLALSPRVPITLKVGVKNRLYL